MLLLLLLLLLLLFTLKQISFLFFHKDCSRDAVDKAPIGNTLSPLDALRYERFLECENAYNFATVTERPPAYDLEPLDALRLRLLQARYPSQLVGIIQNYVGCAGLQDYMLQQQQDDGEEDGGERYSVKRRFDDDDNDDDGAPLMQRRRLQ